jgi:hypothetical protein
VVVRVTESASFNVLRFATMESYRRSTVIVEWAVKLRLRRRADHISPGADVSIVTFDFSRRSAQTDDLATEFGHRRHHL